MSEPDTKPLLERLGPCSGVRLAGPCRCQAWVRLGRPLKVDPWDTCAECHHSRGVHALVTAS